VFEQPDARDLDTLDYVIMSFDIGFTEASIPRPVMDHTLTVFCVARVG
jgi:hypothetical protein